MNPNNPAGAARPVQAITEALGLRLSHKQASSPSPGPRRNYAPLTPAERARRLEETNRQLDRYAPAELLGLPPHHRDSNTRRWLTVNEAADRAGPLPACWRDVLARLHLQPAAVIAAPAGEPEDITALLDSPEAA